MATNNVLEQKHSTRTYFVVLNVWRRVESTYLPTDNDHFLTTGTNTGEDGCHVCMMIWWCVHACWKWFFFYFSYFTIYKIRDVVVFCIKYYTRYILDRTRSRISRSRTHELAGCMHAGMQAGQLKWSGWWMSSDRSYATRCVTHVAWGNCPRVLVPRLPPPLPRASECLRRAPIHACERPSCSANVEESRVRRFLRRRVLPHSRCLV